jgi:transposase
VAIIQANFRRADCRGCPRRPECTRSVTQSRAVTFRPPAQQLALSATRQRQTTAEFKTQYAACAGVEGTLSQRILAFGSSRARYMGLAKTHLQHIISAVVINLVQVMAWLAEMPRGCPQHLTLAALAAMGSQFASSSS